MQWDVFCQVVDNFGDIGVCWRLCSDLAGRGHSVRLWVDDASALSWMAPSQPAMPLIDVRPWPEAEALDVGDPGKELVPGDVVIEAFGCNPPDAFVARMQRATPPVWINLEYLSAEDWVERNHGLRSPVFSGPGAGLSKWFFYPGFTDKTGGLLREPGLLQARDAFVNEPVAQADWLAHQGLAPLSSNERLWSIFCYDHAPVGTLLDALVSDGLPTRLVLTPGPATRLARQWQTQRARNSPHLSLHYLPHLSQPDFDRLLWACDLNFVRGEDSAVRALWAGRPHVWHIYPQQDGVHAGKLDAFMDQWMAGWAPDLADRVRQLWRTWNALPGGDAAGPGALLQALAKDQRWGTSSQFSCGRLAEIPDLTTLLCRFVSSTR